MSGRRGHMRARLPRCRFSRVILYSLVPLWVAAPSLAEKSSSVEAIFAVTTLRTLLLLRIREVFRTPLCLRQKFLVESLYVCILFIDLPPFTRTKPTRILFFLMEVQSYICLFHRCTPFFILCSKTFNNVWWRTQIIPSQQYTSTSCESTFYLSMEVEKGQGTIYYDANEALILASRRYLRLIGENTRGSDEGKWGSGSPDGHVNDEPRLMLDNLLRFCVFLLQASIF